MGSATSVRTSRPNRLTPGVLRSGPAPPPASLVGGTPASRAHRLPFGSLPKAFPRDTHSGSSLSLLSAQRSSEEKQKRGEKLTAYCPAPGVFLPLAPPGPGGPGVLRTVPLCPPPCPCPTLDEDGGGAGGGGTPPVPPGDEPAALELPFLSHPPGVEGYTLFRFEPTPSGPDRCGGGTAAPPAPGPAGPPGGTPSPPPGSVRDDAAAAPPPSRPRRTISSSSSSSYPRPGGGGTGAFMLLGLAPSP